MLHEGVEQLLHAEGVDGAAEEDRRLAPGQVLFQIEGVCRPLQKLHVGAQFLDLAPQKLVQPGILQPLDGHHLAHAVRGIGVKEGDLLRVEVVGAAETLPHPDGPGHGGALDL